MTTVTGLTADRMAEIEDASVVSGEVVGDDLVLTTHGGSTINAGEVRGPQGVQGDPGNDGVGLPVGGTTGQVLSKVDGTDYNVMWSTLLRYASVSLQTNNYTLQAADAESVVMIYVTTSKVVTIPHDTTYDFPIGTRITIVQANTGTVSIAGASGVVATCPVPYVPTLIGPGATVTLIKLGPNAWVIVGNGNLATAELGWQTYNPTITSYPAGTGPSLGTSPVQAGYYIIDSKGICTGGATIRWGTGSPTQGTASVWKLLLPVDGVNYDTKGYSPIGSVSAGMSDLRHNAGVLHFCGNLADDSGNADVGKAIGAMEGGLFLSSTIPSRTSPVTRTVDNVHFAFRYQVKHSVLVSLGLAT